MAHPGVARGRGRPPSVKQLSPQGLPKPDYSVTAFVPISPRIVARNSATVFTP
jgi:hypothetical protein